MTCGGRVDMWKKYATQRIRELEELRVSHFNNIRAIDDEIVTLTNGINSISYSNKEITQQ